MEGGDREAIKAIKRDRLFESYLELSDKHERSISLLKDFITNPSGNALFEKIVRIVDESPPDLELIHHLAVVLLNIAKSDFEALFAEHKYALSQIDRLSPQALTILADARNWPNFKLGSVTITSGIVTSEWVDEFGSAYAAGRGIHEGSVRVRISHSIRDLHNSRLVVAIESDNEDFFRVAFTEVGNLIRKYLQLS